MLFKPEHVEMIKYGFKTQTRRDWKKKMVKVRGVYKVKTEMMSKDYHCKIKVTGIRVEALGDISEADAKREGYSSIAEYREIWEDINGKWDDRLIVYVIDFKLVNET